LALPASRVPSIAISPASPAPSDLITQAQHLTEQRRRPVMTR
jgi:hypothetical protein